MTADNFIEIVVKVAAGCGAIAAISTFGWKVSKMVVRTMRRLNRLVDDWMGVPASPGQPARPGVMERLSRLERTASATLAEVKPNGGNSIKDQITRIETATGANNNVDAAGNAGQG